MLVDHSFKCPKCGVALREKAEGGTTIQVRCPDCATVIAVEVPTAPPPVAVTPAELRKRHGRGAKFCTRCQFIGKPKLDTPGSILIELVLWLFLLVPGLLYSLWRHGARRRVCSKCGSPDIVPVDSPRALRELT